MPPEMRRRFEDLERKVNAMYAVQDVAFIENINRRASSGVKTEPPQDPITILQNVNEGGAGSYQVAAAFDGKVPFFMSDGTRKFLGVYDS